MTTSDLDTLYDLRSGEKVYPEKIQTEAQAVALISAVARKNLQRWTKLYATLNFDYDPISNYDMTETESSSGTTGETDTKNNTITETRDTTDTNSNNSTTTSTGTDTKTTTGGYTDANENTRTDTTSKTTTGSYKDQHGQTSTGVKTTYSGTIGETDTETFTDYQQTTEHEIAGFNSESYSNGDKETVKKNGEAKHTISRTPKDFDSTVKDDTYIERTYNELKDQNGGTIADDGSTTRTYSNLAETEVRDMGYSTTGGSTDTHTGTITTGETGTDTKSGTSSENRTLTRSGNIGVTTSQQMIQSERDLWIWDYFEQIFQDLDRELVIPIWI